MFCSFTSNKVTYLTSVFIVHALTKLHENPENKAMVSILFKACLFPVFYYFLHTPDFLYRLDYA